MIYDLANELDRQRFRHRTAYLLEKGSKVEMSEKSFRTGGQNRYLHLLIGVVALDVGVTLDYAKQEYYKRLVNADIYCIEREDKFVGKVNVLRSSADLTKEEMAMSIDRFKRWGYENGIYMPNPEDEALLRDIEIEMARNRRYL